MPLHNTQIYALCDIELLNKFNFSISQYLQHISQYNIVYIQYRDKINSLEIQKQNIILLKSLTNIPIIINDKLELLSIADGLHLGQEDIQRVKNKELKITNDELLFKFLRKKYPNKIFGISTHNEREILEANRLDLDYIGLGAYRTTNTKDVPNILGENISYLAKISKHPVGVIGGVTLDDEIKNITYYVIGSGLLQ
ncbi:MAG: thiamine phosphate synthase [Arcobacteraceae bacterium]|nr:thiamine phosphate synthase [Arcobacteraceae bacterium]